MRLRRIKLVGLIVGTVIILGLGLLFAPAKLGGSTTYSITSGISMQPLLHKNDLALIRAPASYQVGDVVLYQSQVIHKPVLHRIIVIQNGHYFFKGDNNSFVDPGYVTRSELTGKLWLHFAGLGAILGWVGKPLHAALLAGLAVMMVASTGFMATRHRRHRHGEPRAIFHRMPSYLEGPTLTLATLGILALLAVLLLIVGFSRPARRVAPLANAFQQQGSFSYSAAVNGPSDVYPSGFIQTGQPIYANLANTVTLGFGYHFVSSLPHHIKGTIELKALLLSQTNTWQNLSTIQPSSSFSGDNTSVMASVRLQDLYGLIANVSTQTGIQGVNYSADIQPVVHIVGTVGGKPVNETFEPVMPFTISQSVITLNNPVTPAPPGATYTAPSASSALQATLHPVQAGSIPHLVANHVTFAKYTFDVPVMRVLGIILGGLAIIVAVVHDRLRRRQTRQSDEELLTQEFQSLMVPVASLGSTEGIHLIEVAGFAELARLAQFLEQPILHETSHDGRTYVVDDDTRRYVAHSPAKQAALAKVVPVTVPSISVGDFRQLTRRHPRRTKALLIAAAVLLLLLAITLATSLTASTNVPVSNVGNTSPAFIIDQMAPASCASAVPGLLAVANGSGTYTAAVSRTLVLGSPGVDTMNITGHDDCIVGGAGKDNITAKSTDICIIGPTSGATYSLCQARP